MRKKRLDRKKAMAWFVIIVMSFSIIGFVGGSFFIDSGQQQYPTQEHNGHTFRQVGNSWQLELADQLIPFFFFPTDIQGITIPIDVSFLTNSQSIYVVDQTNGSKIDQVQFLQGIISLSNKRVQLACLEEEGCGDFPIISCDATSAIILEDSDVTSFDANKKCLFVRMADDANLQPTLERLYYQILGVMT